MRVRAGEEITPAESQRLNRAIAQAEAWSGLTFSLYLGLTGEDSRSDAVRLHAELADPPRSVLVLCDVDRRVLEIITGVQALRLLKDVDCRLAAASMQTSFAAGDVVGGLVTGIQQLGQSARHPRTLHSERVSG